MCPRAATVSAIFFIPNRWLIGPGIINDSTVPQRPCGMAADRQTHARRILLKFMFPNLNTVINILIFIERLTSMKLKRCILSDGQAGPAIRHFHESRTRPCLELQQLVD